ncbi:unnamed protein product, partial [Rotaria magnacalcarata]
SSQFHQQQIAFNKQSKRK